MIGAARLNWSGSRTDGVLGRLIKAEIVLARFDQLVTNPALSAETAAD